MKEKVKKRKTIEMNENIVNKNAAPLFTLNVSSGQRKKRKDRGKS